MPAIQSGFLQACRCWHGRSIRATSCATRCGMPAMFTTTRRSNVPEAGAAVRGARPLARAAALRATKARAIPPAVQALLRPVPALLRLLLALLLPVLAATSFFVSGFTRIIEAPLPFL